MLGNVGGVPGEQQGGQFGGLITQRGALLLDHRAGDVGVCRVELDAVAVPPGAQRGH